MVGKSTGVRKDGCRYVYGWIHSWVRGHLLSSIMSFYSCHYRLGDRHCENILLDNNTGDAVHVDFNCLFEKVRTTSLYICFLRILKLCSTGQNSGNARKGPIQIDPEHDRRPWSYRRRRCLPHCMRSHDATASR